MASGKRASMREGPLAQLFRKTDEDEGAKPESHAAPAEPKAGRPLPEGGPSPQITRHVPEPQGHEENLGAQPAEPAASARRLTERSRRRPSRVRRRPRPVVTTWAVG